MKIGKHHTSTSKADSTETTSHINNPKYRLTSAYRNMKKGDTFFIIMKFFWLPPPPSLLENKLILTDIKSILTEIKINCVNIDREKKRKKETIK